MDSRWVPLASRVIKINFDGAKFSNPVATRVCCIGCDSEGSCLAWRQKVFLFSSEPKVVEALAALEGLMGSSHGKEGNTHAHLLARSVSLVLEGAFDLPDQIE
ncbi:hypothetical protein BUALT_BualtUnG0023200 [Buddleja alternifolia]|uniref:RNase H type-1 domain-containing protein n=1 Tax=Buddleja alternifolia TaxID=168488 RepID=A0AAV6W5A3_9LAMI|nr:hypothetical protein BUALT_BualtUnG0023200 [Buddleja alternifolia]